MAVELQWREEQFLELLGKVLGESQHVQNNPSQGLCPKEELVARHVLDVLRPLSTDEGGPLKIEIKEYVSGRPNIVVTYPGTGDKTVALVGMHMDVVPADPKEWDFNPFELTRDGDEIRGRGTTDCLGHVALVTRFMAQLAESAPTLKRSVIAVFISDEECGDGKTGLEPVVADGCLAKAKAGPMYWVDVAETQPCIGTGGVTTWELTAEGRTEGIAQHSAFANDAVNSMELAMDAMQLVQEEFYRLYPPQDVESDYGFTCPSTMKPTQWVYPARASASTIPHTCTIRGDIRMSPFYDLDGCQGKLVGFTEGIDVGSLGSRGPVSKYVLADGTRGKVTLTFLERGMRGYYANKDGEAVDVLLKAVKDVLGTAKPYSVTGSLPCIADLKAEGFDVCCTGFGSMSYYHANNERASLTAFKNGFSVLQNTVNHANSRD
mmetsp:Transcript_12645/g.28289  ORF Transcript_12645/g.28289 Transcript_12645/m.28289 type:complete len:435 (+) Transcript_12645:656-1960(+)|eukprot:CAMPEP_0204275262 /NCGR_PEP_ID=MMETSP0468-20130131/25651_1 /ASSEMBLY_ACC=CAM_ASM_000383 /TAXON_ID=2969 /ORGANISM="Oxyrrhis marina" /LENGTH=434 /DNA_ID=CAMNT_0051251571 /DNA_START=28 /DNA_END=1332 /DNA_ORIENTATION=+